MRFTKSCRDPGSRFSCRAVSSVFGSVIFKQYYNQKTGSSGSVHHNSKISSRCTGTRKVRFQTEKAKISVFGFKPENQKSWFRFGGLRFPVQNRRLRFPVHYNFLNPSASIRWTENRKFRFRSEKAKIWVFFSKISISVWCAENRRLQFPVHFI